MANVTIEDGNEVIEYVHVEHNALEVAVSTTGRCRKRGLTWKRKKPR